MNERVLKAPFPYFGGKSKVAAKVWQALGEVDNYSEPFIGSAAVLLGRPGGARGVETINDKDGFVANFWRSVRHDPESVAAHADNIISEIDLHARHYWLITEGAKRIQENIYDPGWYDAKIAGWWAWGACLWVGSGWCFGNGPWVVDGGSLLNKDDGGGVNRKLPAICGGRGVKRKLPAIANEGRGVKRQLPAIANSGCGVNRQLPAISAPMSRRDFILREMLALHARLREVEVISGDWKRITNSALKRGKRVGVFLDPPYAEESRTKTYANDEVSVSDEARDWAISYAREQGERARVVFCGYMNEEDDAAFKTAGWSSFGWKANGGFGNQKADGRGRENAERETLWLSPHCVDISVRPEITETLKDEVAREIDKMMTGENGWGPRDA